MTPREINAAVVLVHILRHGLPLCRFSYRVPADWPAGHLWVDDTEREHATCDNCRAVALRAVGVAVENSNRGA